MQKQNKVKLLQRKHTPKQLRDFITFLLGIIVALTTIVKNLYDMFMK